MQLEHWKELMTVIECKSLTAGAGKLGYTLSAMSRSIAALEKETGFLLLHRGKKGVTPTKECEQILPYIKELLYADNRLAQAVSAINGCEEGQISIGTAYRHCYRWLSQVTSEFHEIHPGIHFKIYNGTSTEFARNLQEHTLDFCIISEREGIHNWYPICSDSLVALLPVNHWLASSKVIALEEFEKEPYIATCPGLDIDSSRFFKKHGITPNVQFASMDIQATYAMVDAGMGISITNMINSLTGFEGICHRALETTENITIGFAGADDQTPAAQAFLQFVLPRLNEMYVSPAQIQL